MWANLRFFATISTSVGNMRFCSLSSDVFCFFLGRPICFCSEKWHSTFCLTHLEHPVGSPEHLSLRFPATSQLLIHVQVITHTAFVTGSMSLHPLFSIECSVVGWRD